MSSSNTIKGDTSPSYLAHYGRKGQKWGQHIFGLDRASSDGRSRSLSEMSNAELQRVVARKRLESQYKHYAFGRNSEGYSKIAGVTGVATSAANAIGSGLTLAGKLTNKKSVQDVGKLIGDLSKAASNGMTAIGKSDEIAQKRLANSVDLSDMSNAELTKYVNHAILMQQYSELSREDVVTGEEIASSLMGYFAPIGAVSNTISSFRSSRSANSNKPSNSDKPTNGNKPSNSDKPTNGNKPSNANKPANASKPSNGATKKGQVT